MKRILAWATGTITVLVLIFSYRTSFSGPDGGDMEAAAPVDPAAAAAAATTAPGTTTGAGPAPGTATGHGAAPAVPAPRAKPAAPVPAVTTRAVTGPVAQTRWGPVQVKVMLTGTKITNVTILQHPNASQTSLDINAHALPILVQNTLKAQSANIDMVSGATVTSGGYKQSLQAALNQAGLK
jgi:uncharacterized protein with FMN-binding domain